MQVIIHTRERLQKFLFAEEKNKKAAGGATLHPNMSSNSF